MSDNSFASINFNDPESMHIFMEHEKSMCPSYKVNNGTEMNFSIKIIQQQDMKNSFVISGSLSMPNFNNNLFIKYNASSPPTYNSNFSGSGLPYPNEYVAFENTPNKGTVEIRNGDFAFVLQYPNSYYINMGTIYVPPQVKMQVVDKNNRNIGKEMTLNLGEGIPFRTLTWPNQRNWNDGAMFYNNQVLPVRSQYQLLLDSAYPSTNTMPKNFWGSVFPH